MQKYDSVRISVHDDDSEQKLIEMEDIARDLNSIGNRERLSEDDILLKFVNLLPHEYHVQLQMLEEREDEELSREAVVSSVRKRFESALFKKEIARGKKSTQGDQALVAKGGPGKPSGASRKGCLLYTSPSPRDQRGSRMPSSA